MGAGAMIEIVTPEKYDLWRPHLREMHRQRYRIFKQRLGWDVDGENDEERDRYDDLNPTYILGFDGTGRLVSSWRLLPTTGPNMLRDEFSILLEGQAAPSNPDVWECSRFAVDLGDTIDGCLAAVSRTTREIFCGLIEYCLDQGIAEVEAVYDLRVARILPRVGCWPKRKTRVFSIGKTRALAGWFDISQDVLNDVRQAGGIQGPVLRHLPARDSLKAA